MNRFGLYGLSIIILIFILPGCKKTSEEFKEIYPEIRDGISLFKVNAAYSNVRTIGKWNIPRFKPKKGWVRKVGFPGAGFDFFVPQKEKYFLKIRLENPIDFKIKINNHSFDIKKDKTFFSIDPAIIQKGWNSFWVPVQKNQNLFVKNVEFFPKRLSGLKKKRRRGQFFTPAHLLYFLNPAQSEKILVTFDTGKFKDIEADVFIQTEKQVREKKIKLGDYPLKLTPIDNSIHKFRICFPKIKKIITLKKSVKVLKKSKKKSLPISKPKKKLSVLLVLLDAARPDHFGIYGYPRNTTPNIDKLSENALVFTNCYAEAAYTLASTATLLTGLPPEYHGVVAALRVKLDKKITTLSELFKSKGFFTGIITANAYAGRAYNFHLGFDEFVALYDTQKLVLAEQILKPFEDMVRSHQHSPFFIYLHLREPHFPYAMPQPFLGTFQKKYIKQSEKLLRESRKIVRTHSAKKEDLQLLTDLYDENLLYADHVVGKLMDILRKHGIFDHTIKVVLSDHGEALGEHGLIGHNVVLFDEGIRIPLIVSIPGYESGTVFVKKPALTSDLVITLAELFDLNYPFYHSTQGKNLFDLPPDRIRICQGLPFFKKFSIFIIEQYPFKFFSRTPLSSQTMSLYNLSSDPYEKNPLPGDLLKKEYFLNLAKNFLRKKKKFKIESSRPNLSQKDLDNLRSLGYID